MTDLTHLESVIEAAWEARAEVSAATRGEVRDAVDTALALLDSGQARVATRGEDGVWAYTEPDWERLMAVVSGHGPASAERLAFRRLSRAEVDWVSSKVLAEAA